MLGNDYLLDGFSECGTDKDAFANLCNEIDQHTTHAVIPLDSYKIMSVKEEAKDTSEITGTYPCYEFDCSDPIGGGTLREADVSIYQFRDNGFEMLTDEAYENGMVLQDQAGETLFVSINAFNTLAQRIDCDGKTLCHRNVGRDILVAERLGQENKKGTFVYKEMPGAKKLFAVMSEKYAQVPLATVSELVNLLCEPNRLGKGHCRHWEISHKRVEIDLEFPEYAVEVAKMYNLKVPMIPSVKFMTSDIGECSFVAKGYWRLGDNIVPDAEFSREHKGKIETEQLYKAVDENIFDKYVTLPTQLAKLMLVSITPDSADLTNLEEREANRKLILDIFEAVFRKLKFEDILGTKRFNELIDCIDYTYIDDSMKYTGYDLCMDVFALPEHLKVYLSTSPIGETALKKLQKVISKAAYFNYEEAARNNVKQQKLFFSAA